MEKDITSEDLVGSNPILTLGQLISTPIGNFEIMHKDKIVGTVSIETSVQEVTTS